jgi:hypothetical protein
MSRFFEAPHDEDRPVTEPKKVDGFKEFMDGLEKYDRECISINPFDLNDEFTKLPAQVAYWNAELGNAIEDVLATKKEYDEMRARVFIFIKSDSDAKLTVADIDARVTVDVEVEDAHMALVKAEAKKARVKGMVDALHVKKDMLQMIGSKLKIEMEHDPILREQMTGRSRFFYSEDK